MARNFLLNKIVSLDKFWKDCSITFHSITLDKLGLVASLQNLLEKDPEKAVDALKSVLSDLFVKGEGILDNGSDLGEKVQLVKEDILNLPMDIVNKCVEELTGQKSENFTSNSTTPSSTTENQQTNQ